MPEILTSVNHDGGPTLYGDVTATVLDDLDLFARHEPHFSQNLPPQHRTPTLTFFALGNHQNFIEFYVTPVTASTFQANNQAFRYTVLLAAT
jgi:hypothetical protein